MPLGASTRHSGADNGKYFRDDALVAAQTLIDKNPDSQIWCLHIGHLAVEKFGFGDTREQT